MAVFSLENGDLRPAAPHQDIPRELAETILRSLRENATDIIRTPLFPVAWVSEPDTPGPDISARDASEKRSPRRGRRRHFGREAETEARPAAKSTLVGLDAAGKVCTVAVLADLSAVSLMEALTASGRHSRFDRQEILRLYSGTETDFTREWDAFRAMNPPVAQAGPRLTVITLNVAPNARNAVTALAGGGVSVLHASVFESAGSTLLSVEEINDLASRGALTAPAPVRAVSGPKADAPHGATPPYAAQPPRAAQSPHDVSKRHPESAAHAPAHRGPAGHHAPASQSTSASQGAPAAQNVPEPQKTPAAQNVPEPQKNPAVPSTSTPLSSPAAPIRNSAAKAPVPNKPDVANKAEAPSSPAGEKPKAQQARGADSISPSRTKRRAGHAALAEGPIAAEFGIFTPVSKRNASDPTSIARLAQIARSGPVEVRWVFRRRGVDARGRVEWPGVLRVEGHGNFTDPTAAAEVIGGVENANGWELWRTIDGRRLGDL
ncbi:DUF4357 domain-containing protein [Actinobaculum massiliense]|uniref:RAMA domain-containing protein n=1 Tax=Actinobaculum massiliense ACS-171-V-Col2 TaxID=883066 RepID=K9ED43_9ACTO|nr:DUF4357 domain-containing protein [Actinobaculum massiliense]EKU95179.1 hypothetical protein HMPREF9233_00940 [Actinobaculum massiliense ACS-171-V-Col2]MDK8319618.1 hypothetical protein [Actinobaculum massiliense]MDK8567080.1 hypothetical protein [Actinobaculum massiliense]